MSRHKILVAVSRERDAQNKKWGELSADHVPNGTGPDAQDPIYGGEYANIAAERKRVCARESTFANILLEEVFESLAEKDPHLLRDELVQVAAVCVKWIEKLDRVDLAVPDDGGEVAEHPVVLKGFGPLVAAPKSERCRRRFGSANCLLKKGTHPDMNHRAQGVMWAQEED